MTGLRGEGLAFDEDERLPWLEAADDVEEGMSPLRLLAFILGGLLLLGAIIGGVFWARQSQSAGGEGQLIAAQPGTYKEKPQEGGGERFQGQGDASYAASEGGNPQGTIDKNRMPEAPIAAPPAQTKQATSVVKPGSTVSAAVVDDTARPGAKGATKAAAAAPSATLQLGAYGSQAGAESAWRTLAKRFTYLAPLKFSVVPVTTSGGTLYRLRTSAGSPAEAGQMCGKLKVAGENCLLVAN